VLALLASSPGCGGGSQEAETTAASTKASGRVVDGSFAVGSDRHELALRCLGHGSPTIILEAGTDSSGIEQFAGLIPALAKRTTACTYDRVGTGRSDRPTERRRTLDDVVTDLRGLIDAAKVPGPYLLIGQSGGGNIAVHYAGRRPNGVAGVVLLDVSAPSEDLGKEFPGALGWNNPEHIDWVAAERQEARHPLPLGDIPLLVVTASSGQSNVKDQSFWLHLSSNSRQTSLAGGHDIHEDNPAGVVTEVEAMLDAIPG
jgi:pimeloyl-ACP methyl ester carboxylesterase